MGFFVAALLSLIHLILRREYDDWAPRLAGRLVRLAARCHPDPARMTKEWEAELTAIQADPSEAQGLTYAASLFARYSWKGLAVLSPVVVIGSLISVSMAATVVPPERLMEAIGGAMIPLVLFAIADIWLLVRVRGRWRKRIPTWLQGRSETPRWAVPIVAVFFAGLLAAPLFALLITGAIGPQNPIGTALVAGYVFGPIFSKRLRGWLLGWERYRRQLLGITEA
jgi:hypothetical protein